MMKPLSILATPLGQCNIIKYFLIFILLLSASVVATERPQHIKGIYVSGWVSSSKKLDGLISLANRSEINTFVIDVKDAASNTYKNMNPRLENTLAKLDSNGIYPIARIVLFRDPKFVKENPSQAVQDSRTGKPWKHRNKQEWVSPYSKQAWDYNIAIANEVIQLGFKEIQWDYIRLPDVPQSQIPHVTYPGRGKQLRTDAVVGFLKYARQQLPYIKMDVDVFGYVPVNRGDLHIGQHWESILPYVDAIHPMAYPSHYHKGAFGYAYPNTVPYEIIDRTVKEALKRSKGSESKIIFWLQAFTMGQPPYTKHHIQEQIRALSDNGIYQYLLWNPKNRYNFF